jgi:hypothetical protein
MDLQPWIAAAPPNATGRTLMRLPDLLVTQDSAFFLPPARASSGE